MPNWAKLIEQGRARGWGIPASEQELSARSLGIPKEYYFDGVYTLEQYDKVRGTKDAKPRVELETEAKAAGVHFTPDATDKALETALEGTKKGKKKKV